jgi:hypothetical protein
MAKITKHGGASHDPWPLRGVATEPVDDVGPSESEPVEPVDDDGEQEDESVQIPKGNASHAEWAAFVRHQDYPGDPEEATRNDLREWWRGTHGGEDTESVAAGTAAETGPPAGDSAATGGYEADDDDEADDG